MAQIRIDGRVRRSDTREGESGILVRAWDSRANPDTKPIDIDETDDAGRFVIRIELEDDAGNNDDPVDILRRLGLTAIRFTAYRNQEIVGERVAEGYLEPVIEINPPRNINSLELQQISGSLSRIQDTLSYNRSTGSPASHSNTDRSGNSISEILDNAFTGSLGVSGNSEDSLSILKALEQAYPVEETADGRRTFTRMDRSFIVETNLNALPTGGQGALREIFCTTATSIYSSLNKLVSIGTDTDEERAKAAKALLRSAVQELVAEVRRSGGPRVSRVNMLFDRITAQSDLIQQHYQLDRQNVTTVREDQILGEYIKIRVNIGVFRSAWNSYIGDRNYLGTELTIIARALSSIAKSVKDTLHIMDDYELHASERLTIQLFNNIPGQNQFNMTVAELMEWIERFTTTSAPQDIRDGGIEGLISIRPEAQTLVNYLSVIRQLPDVALPHPAFQQLAVRRALAELETYLSNLIASIDDVIQP